MSSLPIRLAENFRAVFYAPFYATAALGLYLKESVSVDLITSSSAGEGVAALLSGKVDVAWGGPMRVMKAHDSDPASPLVCFGEVIARDPFFLVVANQCRAAALADLQFVRFAAVSEVPTPWLCLQEDLRQCGVDPAGFERGPAQSMAANFEALCEGRLDVAQLFEPYASMTVQSGAGRILYAASTRGPTVYTTFISTRPAIERYREQFSRMLRAIGQMQEWLVAHGAQELTEITAPYFPHIARDVLISSLGRYREGGVWAQSPEVSKEGFRRLGECLRSGGFLSRAPIYAECVDQSIGAHDCIGTS
jgi:NitT/TauT family transport system substrate-binding protein